MVHGLFEEELELTAAILPRIVLGFVNKMKILVIGGGGREHALVWKLKQSACVEKIWCAPGNGGISNDAECVPLDLGSVTEAADLAAKLGVDLMPAPGKLFERRAVHRL